MGPSSQPNFSMTASPKQLQWQESLTNDKVNENDVSIILSPSRVDKRLVKLDHISRNIQNLAIGLNLTQESSS